MKILIIEDEAFAAKNLSRKILQLRPDWTILEVCDSVHKSLERLQQSPAPDLIFSDIELSDGLSFSIFQNLAQRIPIIFTTAYSDYALEAFKHAGVAYLLKPIDRDELLVQIEKLEQLRMPDAGSPAVAQLLQALDNRQHLYKERLLIKKGEKLYPINCRDVVIFYTDEISWALDDQGRKHPLDQSLNTLETLLDPGAFFRVNRGCLVHREAVLHASQYFNGRLKLKLCVETADDIIVSRERTRDFRQWLES